MCTKSLCEPKLHNKGCSLIEGLEIFLLSTPRTMLAFRSFYELWAVSTLYLSLYNESFLRFICIKKLSQKTMDLSESEFLECVKRMLCLLRSGGWKRSDLRYLGGSDGTRSVAVPTCFLK